MHRGVFHMKHIEVRYDEGIPYKEIKYLSKNKGIPHYGYKMADEMLEVANRYAKKCNGSDVERISYIYEQLDSIYFLFEGSLIGGYKLYPRFYITRLGKLNVLEWELTITVKKGE